MTRVVVAGLLVVLASAARAQPAPAKAPAPAPVPAAGPTTGAAPAPAPPPADPNAGKPIEIPAYTPPAATPATKRAWRVMDRRWAVAVGLGVESMKPKPDASSTIGFTTFELAGRFRIRPAIEVALALNGAGAFSGNFASGGLGADFRYRFMAEESVNFYVLGGIGVQAAAAKNAPEVETKGRALFRIGGGAELRYNPIALSADLRLYGIAENPDVPDAVPSTTRYEIARYSVSGIQLVFGATYYF